MLKIKNMSKTFNKNTVNENPLFNDFSLNIKEGEFVSVIGSNGAGKSTLLNIIAGEIKEDEGKIIIDNVDMSKKAEFIRNRTIGRVFQDPSLGVSPKMTILENLSLADNKGKKFDLSFLVDRKRINHYKEILSEVNLGLEDKIETKVKFLSGGQRQALTLLMAVMGKPKILLLDEHTAALDPKTSVNIMDITRKIIKKNRITTLMVTHNLKNAIDNGNRLIMLHEGKVVIDLDRKEKENLDVEKLFGLFEKVNVKNDLSSELIFSLKSKKNNPICDKI